MAGSRALRAIPCFLTLLLFSAQGAAASAPLEPARASQSWPLAVPKTSLGVTSKGPLRRNRPVLSARGSRLPLPAQDAWSIQRRLESLGDADFERTAAVWVQEMGDPARRALLLCAGATPSPGLTISGRERRQRQSSLALEIMRKGLAHAEQGPAWRNMLREALAFSTQPGGDSEAPLAGQGVLAAINVVAGLQLTEFSDSVSGYMIALGKTGPGASGPETEHAAPERCAFLLHDEAQLCLFRLYGVWFASREEFLAFPRPPAGQATLFRKAFAGGAERESRLALQLLEAQPDSGLALLQHPDASLRGKAVERLIRAVGEQAMSLASVRKTLADSVLRESNPEVSDAMLQGLLDLALAAGPDSPAVPDLRLTLQECARQAPIALVPSLLSAFDRLPRPDGEAGRDVAAQDGASTSQLLESLWKPVLRLDRDTTILTLRAWSRVQNKLNGFALGSEPQRRAGTLVLQLMADPSEPERVRLVAAEALVGWPLDLAAMQQVLSILASDDSSAHLRRAAYPLVQASLADLPWQELDGPGLMDSLLRDMGHGDVDLRGQAIRISSSDHLLHRFSELEASQGSVLPVCLNWLENEKSVAVGTGLMDWIIQVAAGNARPDLLTEHLQRPIAKQWVVSGQIELAHLARTYQALAGPGHGSLLVGAALSWARDSEGLAHGAYAREQALALALTIDGSEAAGFPVDVHRALYDMALEHLLNAPKGDATQWSQAHGNRLLTVHISALRAAPQPEGEAADWKQVSYLEAKLLAAAVVEDDGAVRTAFNGALSESKGKSRQRLLVLRDRSRFLDSFGKSDKAKAEWVRLALWMSQDLPEGVDPVLRPGLDYEDLGHLTAAADRASLFNLACRMWLLRTAQSAWKSETPAVCSQELITWAQAAEKTDDPRRLQQWLSFVESQVLVGGSSEGWLKLPEADLAPLGERATRLRALRVDWLEAAQVSEGKVAPEVEAIEPVQAPQPEGAGGEPEETAKPPVEELVKGDS